MLKRVFAILMIAVFAVPFSVFAQDPISEGLNSPRNLFVAEDGTLYVAEAGFGGDIEFVGPEGPTSLGLTSQLSAISPDGELQVLVQNFPSAANVGISAVHVTEDSIWIVTGEIPHEIEIEDAELVEAIIALGQKLIQFDLATLEVLDAYDLYAYEVENNPAGGDEILSNPNDIAVAEDGTIYVTDSGCNCLYSLSEGELSVVAAWEDNPVPTGVAVSPNGDLVVGFLSHAPFIPGTAKVERWSADGELLNTYEGLTMVVGVYVDEEDTIYAVELAQGLGEAGFVPESGRVVALWDEEVEVVAEGLSFPYGITQDNDGNLLVSINAIGAPGSGSIITLP